MKMEADNLKQLYQAYVASMIPADRKSCPSPRALLKTIKPSGSYRKKKRLIDHISKCSYCKEEFCFLLKLNNYENNVLININDASRKSFSLLNPVHSISPPHPLMKYASILLGFTLIISSFFLIQKKEDYPDSQRRRNHIIQLINPTDVHILPNPLIFLWRKHPKAQYYILDLFDDTLLPFWRSPKITGLGFHLPEEILAIMKKNKYYFWMISAFSSTEKVAESDLASFFTLII
jgi:hypothetical protein